jgi:energy-coupling factor transporter ATP-binding protein EcfA2
MVTDAQTEQESRFEVRAENLSSSELQAWTVLSDAEKQVVRKLTGPGAKLISGPRGSGKSTLLRLAFFELLKAKTALPVYVNFSKALALEPLFYTHADALKWFRSWVLSKIVDGVGETFAAWGHELPVQARSLLTQCKLYITGLETGRPPDSDALQLSPSSLGEFLSQLARLVGTMRTVLLLDDAAHAFSVKQQREFFEVFRELRSREISAKAAIYPGVTSFSPSFQVGHEAEVIEAWFRPDTETYLDGIEQIATRRFPELAARLGESHLDVVHALGLAAFGLPRGFVNMIGEVTDQMDLDVPARKAALAAIATQAESVHAVFQNIADKLPRFANYVNLGKQFFTRGTAALREFNRSKLLTHKSTTIGLTEPFADELDRTLRFMEYAGLIRRIEDLSKGVKGNYRRYSLHYACLIDANGLSLGKNYKLSDVVTSLRRPLAHSLIKTKPESLLGSNYSSHCTLALPPCPKCGTPRLSEDQKFCMNCGNELRSASLYGELLRAPVALLPIPERKKEALRASQIETIQQILSDESQRFRKPGSSIGPIWARRIVTVAEEYISV